MVSKLIHHDALLATREAMAEVSASKPRVGGDRGADLLDDQLRGRVWPMLNFVASRHESSAIARTSLDGARVRGRSGPIIAQRVLNRPYLVMRPVVVPPAPAERPGLSSGRNSPRGVGPPIAGEATAPAHSRRFC